MPEDNNPWFASPIVGAERLYQPGQDLNPGLEALYEPDSVVAAVRTAVCRLRGLHPGDPDPLREVVRPGDRVVIKPNLIRQSALGSDEWRHVITHPSVVAAAIDLAATALHGTGEIMVADGPQTDSSFDLICQATGLPGIVETAGLKHGIPVRLVDLRQEEWTGVDGVTVESRRLPGDPSGYTEIDLGEMSEFVGHSGEGQYYGAAFDTRETNHQHRGTRHRYRVSGSVMECDVLINVPKLKTHKKAGITASLKNLVGVNGNKNWLPHFTQGIARGDQYPAGSLSRHLEAALLRLGKRLISRLPFLASSLLPAKRAGRQVFGDTSKTVRSGNWYGNDTLWRMVLDLNRAVLWHDRQGNVLDRPRRYLSIVDAVVMGQGRGPEDPEPAVAGWLLAGFNPVAVDAACASLMGFDWNSIPSIRHGFGSRRPSLTGFEPTSVQIRTGQGSSSLDSLPEEYALHLEPHFGWQGHIEKAC